MKSQHQCVGMTELTSAMHSTFLLPHTTGSCLVGCC